jgi:hypothetical protein
MILVLIPACYFCDQNESISHLLFQCSTAEEVWAVVAHSIGADNIPKSFDQCWEWFLGKKFHAVGTAAICWTIWKTRNSVCFEGKIVTNGG